LSSQYVLEQPVRPVASAAAAVPGHCPTAFEAGQVQTGMEVKKTSQHTIIGMLYDEFWRTLLLVYEAKAP